MESAEDSESYDGGAVIQEEKFYRGGELEKEQFIFHLIDSAGETIEEVT